MAERLPFGQVTPVARPLDSFIQPSAQQNVPKPAAPSEIQVSSGLRAISGGGGGSIASQADPGRNLRAVARALTPFNRALTTTLTGGAVMLKAQQIDAGYIEAQNEYAKAQLILQQQSEVSATNAASQITQLEKVDPVAAILLKDANPWKQIGRRRAIAQIAGNDVNSALSAALSQDFGRLAGLPPGSGELMKVRVDVTNQFMQRYGLNEDMPEVAQYFTPQMTRAWDKFATKHEQAYNDQLEASTTALGTAAMGSGLQSLYENGIPFNGAQVMPGDPMWPQLAGLMLTQEMDKQLQMLGGSSRVKAAKEMREQLMGSFGQVPGMAEALTFVRGGDPSVPMEKRPTWGASNPLDMIELKNRGNEARIKDYELGQQSIEQKLDALWYQAGSPGALLPSDPAYPAALITFRNQAAALGYRDVDSYLNNRMSATSSVLEEAYRPDPLASQDFLNSIEDAPPSTFSSPAGLKALREQARAAARAEPTPELQAERYREYNEAIERKRRQAEEATPGVQRQIDQALLQDLALPAVAALADKGKPGGSSLMQSLIQQGASPAAAAASAFGQSNVVAFTNGVQNLYLRSAEDAINDWREANPGRALSEAAKNRIVSQAVADARKSKEYADLYSTLTGLQPGQVGQGTVGTGPSQGTQPGPQARGVPKASASSLPDSTVKGYAARPVLDGSWLHSELSNVANGKPVSAELYQLAKRAGTSTNRYLLEQLRFYPQLDPDGEARRHLEGEVRKQRQGQQLSSANYRGATGGLGMVPTGYNPLAPGSWLMNLLMPPAAAATLPEIAMRRPASGGVPGNYQSRDPRGQALIAMAARNGWDAADLAAVFSFETGGTLNPGEPGRGAAAGRIGLIQAGAQERADYGLGSGDWNREIIGVERYLKARGFKAGMSLADLYATVNGGNPSAGNTPDGNGVVARSASTQRALQRHRQQALTRLGITTATPAAAPPSQASPAAIPAGWKPAKGVASASAFGARESFRNGKGHEGMDISFAQGTPLAFSVGGQVLKVYRTTSRSRESNGGYGNFMDIRLDNGLVVRMAHLSQIPQGLAAGSRFTPGQPIALSGGQGGTPGAGRSTGAHLHFEEHSTSGMGIEETTRGKLNPARRGGALDFLIHKG